MADPNLDLESLIDNVGAGRLTARRTPELTASSRLAKWAIAERMAPTVLEYQQELLNTCMSEVRELIAYIEESSFALQEEVDAPRPADQTATVTAADIKIRLLVVETELERVKFVVRNYLRARIAKIDAYLVHYAVTDAPELSTSEKAYVQQHLALLHKHYRSSFLGALPDDLDGLADESSAMSMVDAPDLDKPVALRVVKHAGNVAAGTDVVELERNGVYMLRYSAIAHLVGDSVELV